MDQIELDIDTTLPSIHIFNKETGPMYNDLKDMLCAWVVSRSDEGLGYTMGVSKVAAMLLINMQAQQAFVVMRNLLERHLLRSFFGGERARDDVGANLFAFYWLATDCVCFIRSKRTTGGNVMLWLNMNCQLIP